jgi:hypothetical protein
MILPKENLYCIELYGAVLVFQSNRATATQVYPVWGSIFSVVYKNKEVVRVVEWSEQYLIFDAMRVHLASDDIVEQYDKAWTV